MKITNNAPAALFGAAFGIAALTLGYSLPAAAAPEPGAAIWVANGDSEIVDQHTVKLVGPNTSVEAKDLGLVLDEETSVSFAYKLGEGATCTGGAPRVFLVVDGKNHNSWDQLLPDGKQCGTDGVVTFTVPEGPVTEAGVVFDNGQEATVTVESLSIDDNLVNFKATVPSPDPSPSESESPSPSPSASESASPSPSASRGGENGGATKTASPSPAAGGSKDDPSLPVTGPKVTVLVVGGLVAAALGVAAVAASRRRKVNFEA